ncbi:spore germination protein GerPE [Thalassobacillus devorans]|uniref:spore germination protein GerPE n=1 Tax=Thalassobacillus devorans TaxID=279813 RepID=UPI000A1C9073|nr:spore germination protein GerPE [Thalassobacillus devorans]
MNKRLVKLDDIKVINVVYGTTFIIGDSHRATPFARVIAIQKEGARFDEEIYSYDQYPLFTRQFKRLPPSGAVNDIHYQHNPTINVGRVRVNGASTSSMIQIGSLDELDAEARVKHIRILQDEQEENTGID